MTEIPAGAESFEALVQLLGQADALVFCHHYGGQRLYIARKPKRDLVERVGRRAAERLSQEFPSMSIDVPLGPVSMPSKRRMLVLKGGRTNNEIARLGQMTTRNVRMIRAALQRRRTKKHPDLFED